MSAESIKAILERLEEHAIMLNRLLKENAAIRAEVDRAISAAEGGDAAEAYVILCAIAHRSPRKPGGDR